MIKIIHFPKIIDERGNLTFLQSKDLVPFDIKRVFWTYDVPGGESRGGHANKNLDEIVIAVSGSFDIVVTDNGSKQTCYCLNRSYIGLFIPKGTWRQIENFSTNAVSLHICSNLFEESDYIRDFEDFKGYKL
jgi:dTDP-4-dehydrorhamnose 3,5-epimerase-like enzyme